MRTQQKYRVEQKYNENKVSQKVHKKVSIATGEKRKKEKTYPGVRMPWLFMYPEVLY